MNLTLKTQLVKLTSISHRLKRKDRRTINLYFKEYYRSSLVYRMTFKNWYAVDLVHLRVYQLVLYSIDNHIVIEYYI